MAFNDAFGLFGHYSFSSKPTHGRTIYESMSESLGDSYNKDFNGAYNELGRAIQMPGGDKYKAQYENAVRYKQQADANRAAAATKKSAAPAKARPADDDDD